MFNFIINIHEGKKKVSRFLYVSNAHNLQLHILNVVVDIGTEVYIESFTLYKLAQNVVTGKCHPHHVPVVCIDRNIDIEFQGIIIELFAKFVIVKRTGYIVHANNPYAACHKIDHKDIGIIYGKGVDNFQLVDFFFFPLVACGNVFYNGKA